MKCNIKKVQFLVSFASNSWEPLTVLHSRCNKFFTHKHNTNLVTANFALCQNRIIYETVPEMGNSVDSRIEDALLFLFSDL